MPFSLVCCFAVQFAFGGTSHPWAVGRFNRGSRAYWGPDWGSRQWSSVHELSSAMRDYERQSTGVSPNPVQSPSPVTSTPAEGSSTPTMPSANNPSSTGFIPLMSRPSIMNAVPSRPDPSYSPNQSYSGIASGSRTSLDPYGYTMSTSQSNESRPEFLNTTSRTDYSTSILSPALPERHASSGSFTTRPNALPPTSSVSQASAMPSTQNTTYNSRYNHGQFTTVSHPPAVVYRDPQTTVHSEAGRTVSNYLGIASDDPFSRSVSRGSGGSAFASNASPPPPTPEEEQPETEAPAGPPQAGLTGEMNVRRIVDPYDLSHIFPDIYHQSSAPAYHEMTNQSLDFLEMTATD